MKNLLLFVFHSFKLVGVKSLADLKRRFGNSDISMPPNSTKEEWLKALQNMCEKRGLELKSIPYDFCKEENSPTSKITFTHIWFLGHSKNVIIAKDYEFGHPKITLGLYKEKAV